MDARPFDIVRSTAAEVKQLIRESKITSVELAERVLGQIDAHNGEGAGLALRAIVSRPPRELVLERARRLDEEREMGARRPLHGIPCLVSESIATVPELGMTTSAGTWALVTSKPKENAHVVKMLLKAGMIIVGKTNVTELNHHKGSGVVDGWSPVGGQTISPYVAGGINPADGPSGHSTPGGASAGSAVGVAAGFAPVAVGLESASSFVSPASRAGLYGMRPTHGLVHTAGVVKVTDTLDSICGMAKSPYDLADLIDIIREPPVLKPWDDYMDEPTLKEAMSGERDGFRLGFLDETVWRVPDFLCHPNQDVLNQMYCEYRGIISKLRAFGVHVQHPVEVPEAPDIWYAVLDIITYEIRNTITDYVQDLEYCEVGGLGDLVWWNAANADREMPPGHDQRNLEFAIREPIKGEQNKRAVAFVRNSCRKRIDEALDKHNLDAILCLSESMISSVAAGAGYPIATMPLGVLELNGRPFGISMIGRANSERKLFQIMAAWDTLVKRVPPPALV